MRCTLNSAQLALFASLLVPCAAHAAGFEDTISGTINLGRAANALRVQDFMATWGNPANLAVLPRNDLGGELRVPLCNNKVITAVGKCARDIKSAMPLASNDQLRPMVQACVFQDAELQQKVTPECLSCTITAAECAGDNCLLECLAGDSSGCDNCRKQFNCDQPVFACGGIPSPL